LLADGRYRTKSLREKTIPATFHVHMVMVNLAWPLRVMRRELRRVETP
jgi:hypothetical protein